MTEKELKQSRERLKSYFLNEEDFELAEKLAEIQIKEEIAESYKNFVQNGKRDNFAEENILSRINYYIDDGFHNPERHMEMLRLAKEKGLIKFEPLTLHEDGWR